MPYTVGAPLNDRPRKFDYNLASSELRYTTAPYSYEYIPERKSGKWRIRDAKDNAVGRAENEEAAQFICDHLNKCAQ